MEIKAKIKHLRIAPRKVRLVANLIRGMNIDEAEIQLKFYSKKSAISLLKLLNSAIANAENNFNLEKKALFIKEIFVNEGPPFKRWRPASRGRANQIIKRTSHIELTLGVKKGFKAKKDIKETIPIRKDSLKSKEKVENIKPEKEKEERKIEKKVSKKDLKKIDKKINSKNILKKVFRRKSF